MSFNKLLPSRLLGLALGFMVSLSAMAVESAATSEAPPVAEAVTPKETMFQAGRAYIVRVSDRLADTVTGKSEELINRAMEVIGVRYRWILSYLSLDSMEVAL